MHHPLQRPPNETAEINSFYERARAGLTNCGGLKFINTPVNLLLAPLIQAVLNLKPSELLDIQKYEEEHVDANSKEPSTINDSNVNMKKYCN